MVCLLLRLRHHPGEKTLVATASARLYYGCCTSQGRINVSAVPVAPPVLFQTLSLCLAYSQFSKQYEQQDSWRHKQVDQGYIWHSWQDTQQIEEPDTPLGGGSLWPPYSMWL